MRIEMFGGLRVRTGKLSLHLRSRQAETLLATLALSPGHYFSRAELAERLWPEAPPAAARSRFKQELSALRRTLGLPTENGFDLLQADPDGICLPALHFTTDVSDFEACLRSSESLQDPCARITVLETALRYLGGPLLPGNYDPHILQERGRLTQLHGEALRRLARLYAAEGDLVRAVQSARSAVQNDPLQEATRGDLLCFYLLSGLPQDAQTVLDDYTHLLMQELGESPSSHLLLWVQHIAAFAEAENADQALRTLSPPLHKLLHTIAQSGEAEAIDASDLALLEMVALLHDLGLLTGEPSGPTMTYRLLPALKELLKSAPFK